MDSTSAPTATAALRTLTARTAEALTLIRELEQKIASTQAAGMSNSHNWGYAGDMAHIVSSLRDLLGYEDAR